VADSLVRDLLDLETAEFDCLLERLLGHVNVSIRQHTSAYVSIRQLLEPVTSWPRKISQIIFTDNFHRYCAQTHINISTGFNIHFSVYSMCVPSSINECVHV
jgi:hypothetical protein